jgi:hypothetical protein
MKIATILHLERDFTKLALNFTTMSFIALKTERRKSKAGVNIFLIEW